MKPSPLLINNVIESAVSDFYPEPRKGKSPVVSRDELEAVARYTARDWIDKYCGVLASGFEEPVAEFQWYVRSSVAFIVCEKFIYKLARYYSTDPNTIERLVGAGMEGMLGAVGGYDPAQNDRFIYYAQKWIKAGIEKELRQDASIIIPSHVFRQKGILKRRERALTQSLARMPMKEDFLLDAILQKELGDELEFIVSLWALEITPLEEWTGSTDDVYQDDEKYDVLTGEERALWLIKLEGYPNNRIATAYGVSRKTITRRLRRVAEKLV